MPFHADLILKGGTLVNHDGVVFQKDLGEDTAAAAAAMTSFDPDASWVAVTESSGT